jgi:hypothetical protein
MVFHPVSRSGRLAAAVAALACASCGIHPQVVEGNYLTYHHPFTDAAAAGARKSAERLCGERGQLAVQTSRACSLTECATSYQCTDGTDVEIPDRFPPKGKP